MTALFAWFDESGATLVADSAATHSGNAIHHTSSFGDIQEHDGRTIEERFFKIVLLPHGILAGVCGDASAGADFLRKLRNTMLSLDTAHINVALTKLGRVPAGTAPFQIILAHTGTDRTNRITELTSLSQFRTHRPSPKHPVIHAGSLGKHLRDDWARRGIMTIAEIAPISSATRLGLTCSYLRGIGIFNQLTAEGVGGPFFGARHNLGCVEWAPDMLYVTVQDGSPRPCQHGHLHPFPGPISTVRTAIRQGVGMVSSSFGNLLRVLSPVVSEPGQGEIAFSEFPHPERVLHDTRYISIFHTKHHRLTFIDRGPDATGGALLRVLFTKEGVGLRPSPELVGLLDRPVPDRRCYEICLFREKDGHLETLRRLIPVYY